MIGFATQSGESFWTQGSGAEIVLLATGAALTLALVGFFVIVFLRKQDR